jgi:hypothetical protein
MSTTAATMATRAAASRRNGAKSRGPKTAEGKARSARNALKHGLCGQRFVVLGDKDLAAFDALEAALTAELAPQGALQAVLVRRIVAATWRLEWAERLAAGTGLGPRFPRGRAVRAEQPGYHQLRSGHDPRLQRAPGPGWGKGPQPLSGPGAARSTRCCAIAAARSPSSGAPCAPSRPSRPGPRPRRRSGLSLPKRRRLRGWRPSHPLLLRHPRAWRNRTNPSTARILAIRTKREIRRTGTPSRVQTLPGGHCHCRHQADAPCRSNPRTAGILANQH